MYARDETQFNSRMEIWEANIQGVMVKVGTGESARYKSLAGYCLKNWHPEYYRKMWARYERKTLPLGQEHTTNRLERCYIFEIQLIYLYIKVFRSVERGFKSEHHKGCND